MNNLYSEQAERSSITDMSHNSLSGGFTRADFRAPWWAKNRHVQTIFPRFLQKRAALTYRREDFQLSDGDKVRLVWVGEVHRAKALVVLFHGLEGSIDSHYCHDTAAYLEGQGYAVVLMHFRGCGGEPNSRPRAYHSGETSDPREFLSWLAARYPDIPKFAIGFSLGANMLLKLLGEQPLQKLLCAAVAISPPLDLAECANSINRGFSRIYQAYLLRSMLNTLAQKMRLLDYRGKLSLQSHQLKEIKSFWDFDQRVTAPLHGFKDASDYYQQCSAMSYLSHIATPTLVLHAKDDPFMNQAVIPQPSQLSTYVRFELSDNGGHCGFVGGSPWRPTIWFQQRITAFFKQLGQTKAGQAK